MASVESQRLFRCDDCDRSASICRSCDRGQRYCSRDCARQARLKAHREANRRYQATARGRVTASGPIAPSTTGWCSAATLSRLAPASLRRFIVVDGRSRRGAASRNKNWSPALPALLRRHFYDLKSWAASMISGFLLSRPISTSRATKPSSRVSYSSRRRRYIQ